MMKKIVLFLFITVFLTASCQKSSDQQVISATAKRYPFHGTIVSVDKAKKQATIAHDAVPGYMEAMTMPFPIRNESVLNTLTKDSEIRGELLVDDANNAYWVEISQVIAAPDSNNPALPLKETVVQINREVPAFKLTNQDGKQISINDFRGKALAITFIYTRCPLPDYCILMSKRFSDLANQLATNDELKDKIRLLSISFDPQIDTPETLKNYGLGYLGKNAKPDFTVWQLATASDKEVREIADFFGLYYGPDEKNKNLIDHSLRTIVISPDGKVRKVFPGNEWTNDQLLKELQDSLK